MKSLNTNTTKGCPFDNKIFTDDVIKHIFAEGFSWEDVNDSYTSNEDCYDREYNFYGCYKKYEDGNGTDIYIYICEDGIEIDQDYDCGGNLSTNFISYNNSFEEAYDEMVKYVNGIKGR